jgi:hypothetical protein
MIGNEETTTRREDANKDVCASRTCCAANAGGAADSRLLRVLFLHRCNHIDFAACEFVERFAWLKNVELSFSLKWKMSFTKRIDAELLDARGALNDDKHDDEQSNHQTAKRRKLSCAEIDVTIPPVAPPPPTDDVSTLATLDARVGAFFTVSRARVGGSLRSSNNRQTVGIRGARVNNEIATKT